jgi:hypothetical protein
LQQQQQVEPNVDWYQNRISSPFSGAISIRDDFNRKPTVHAQSEKIHNNMVTIESDEQKAISLEQRIRGYRKSTSMASESSSYTSTTTATHDNINVDNQARSMGTASIDSTSLFHPIIEPTLDQSTRNRSQTASNLSMPAATYDTNQPTTSATTTVAAAATATTETTTSDAEDDKETFDLLLQLYESWK